MTKKAITSEIWHEYNHTTNIYIPLDKIYILACQQFSENVKDLILVKDFKIFLLSKKIIDVARKFGELPTDTSNTYCLPISGNKHNYIYSHEFKFIGDGKPNMWYYIDRFAKHIDIIYEE